MWFPQAARGTFAVREGTVDVAATPGSSAVRAGVDLSSLDAHNARRDADVTSCRFLALNLSVTLTAA
jgi:polyisoprenoid-binding protein YceI